ncbi:MAG: ftsY, partial [Dehalococcoidia bacterium]|nr:ftsY [Dehalococcoidia bacterium]
MVLGLFRRRDNKDKIEQGLHRTKETWFSRIARLLEGQSIEAEVWDELEELLVSADVGVETAEALIKAVRVQVDKGGIKDLTGVKGALKEEMVRLLTKPASLGLDSSKGASQPWVILVVGVNGTGKTTTIAKLA